MKYVGSKNKLGKTLSPIIQSYINEKTEHYIEPFVGGANMIDKIEFDKKVGYDINKYLISLLNEMKKNTVFKKSITKDEYMLVRDNKELYPDWIVGFIGFCGSYNGKFFGGYAGNCNTKQGIRHYDQEAIRNIEKQRINIKNIEFKTMSFTDISRNDEIKNSVIYCDPPYRDTTKYSTSDFPYDDFYKWCIKLSKNNVVLISEYSMPEDRFECIWEKEHKTSLDKNNPNKKRIEKLFIVKGGK